MRPSFRRALALLAALPLATVLGASTAHAAPACDTPVVAFEAIGVGEVRVAYSTSDTTTLLCVEAGLEAEVVVAVDHDVAVTPPLAWPTGGTHWNCPTQVVRFTHPVQTTIYAGVGYEHPWGAVCYSRDSEWAVLVILLPTASGTPGVDVWIPEGSAGHTVYCSANTCSGDVKPL